MTAKRDGRPLWRRVLASLLGVPHPVAADTGRPRETRSATQIYLDGGGNPANERTMAILREADRPHHATDAVKALGQTSEETTRAFKASAGAFATPLHAHEITADDAALIRMMAGASFGPDATVTLPSGRTITGAEMKLWLDANGS